MKRIKNKTFYMVVGFKNKKIVFDKDGYIRIGNARRVAAKLLQSGCERVVLKKEEVFLRDDNNEFSAIGTLEELRN